ncbi:D-2-hydroxyglutarate--pyruvate transhydrogenase DLD2 [Nymphon striatum]|nr:D-2-hydroxyglutarate--pyruvate transhydrogenase DLD2 [Nymphon striatum]
MDNAIRAQFIDIVGVKNALTNAADIAPHLTEWRDRWQGKSSLVLKPGSTAEVAAILKLATQSKTPIVPQGGNTGLVGGGMPDMSGEAIILSTARLNTIRNIDPAGNTITVEAGCILQNVQHAADEAHRLFPLSLGSQGTCQIGGNLSSNCRRHRCPKGKATAIVAMGTPDDALRIFQAARDLAGQSLTAFELMPRLGIEFTCKHIDVRNLEHFGIYVNLYRLVRSPKAALSSMIFQCRCMLFLPSCAMQKTLYDKIEPQARFCTFGHLGDGNLHYNVSQPIDADKKAFLAMGDQITEAVHTIVRQYGGSISAEHGIGQMKRDELSRIKNPVALDLMKRIKNEFDPAGIMNPGKVI